MITLDFTNREPIYEQLKNKITRLALTGALQPNEQLPSVRLLAKELMVNPNTVQKAYQYLEQTGVIYSIPGKGSFVAPDIHENSRFREEMKGRLHDVLQEAISLGLDQQEVEQLVADIFEGGHEEQ